MPWMLMLRGAAYDQMTTVAVDVDAQERGL